MGRNTQGAIGGPERYRKTIMRYSRQREAIRSYVEGRHDHPTADSVYAAVREELPNISLGTVYRNLMQLVDAGELQVVNTGDSVSRFDPMTCEHAHFRCQKCGKVMDVKGPVLADLTALTKDSYGKINSYVLCFTGICNDCLAHRSKSCGSND